MCVCLLVATLTKSKLSACATNCMSVHNMCISSTALVALTMTASESIANEIGSIIEGGMHSIAALLKLSQGLGCLNDSKW